MLHPRKRYSSWCDSKAEDYLHTDTLDLGVHNWRQRGTAATSLEQISELRLAVTGIRRAIECTLSA